jgi:hypothetical protein
LIRGFPESASVGAGLLASEDAFPPLAASAMAAFSRSEAARIGTSEESVDEEAEVSEELWFGSVVMQKHSAAACAANGQKRGMARELAC